MAVPYTFGSATTSIPLSQLDSNFATTITLGNTAVQLGNTITNLTGVSNLASATSLSLGSNGNTTVITVDTSQNVGIGTSSPGQKLEVNNGASDVTVLSKTTGASYASFRVTNSSRDYSMQIRTDVSNAWVLRDEIAGSNRLNVDTSGRVSIGGAGYGPGNSCLDLFAIQGVNNAMNIKPTTNSTYTAIQFFNSSQSSVGAITCTTSATTYGTGSDYRLKENVLPMTGALNKVAQLRPVTFDWISDKTASQGFIAHELQTVVPDAVVGEKDAVDADGNPKYQAIDTSFLVATLTAAIQEQQALITAQAETINALSKNNKPSFNP